MKADGGDSTAMKRRSFLRGTSVGVFGLVGIRSGSVGSAQEYRQLRIIAAAGADAFNYSFTIDGQAELVTSGEYGATPKDKTASGRGEEIVENDNGTVTVAGIVADGGGDTFRFTGEIVSHKLHWQASVYVDGEEVYIGRDDSSQLRIVAAEGADAVEYSFVIKGDASLVTSGEYAATPKHDTSSSKGEEVVKNDDGTVTVNGIVADGGGDTIRYIGSFVSHEINGDATVYINGEPVNRTNLPATPTATSRATTTSSPTSTIIGGADSPTNSNTLLPVYIILLLIWGSAVTGMGYWGYRTSRGSRGNYARRNNDGTFSSGGIRAKVFSSRNRPSDTSNRGKSQTRLFEKNDQEKEMEERSTCPGCGFSLKNASDPLYCPNCGIELS